jgi:spermine oxidase
VNVEEKIIFNKKVVNIDYSAADQVKIECSDGSEYFADQVIVTVPLGVLKAHHETMFTPKLPKINVKAM